MRLMIALLLACGIAAPAAALNICDELWFTRNLAFDRAGYCFGSPLGQAVFDNSNCTTHDPVASRADQVVVDQVLEIEAEWECHIDTHRRSLDIPFLDLRRQMADLPVPHGYESACIGWRGTSMTLHSARSDKAAITGIIASGEDILFQFLEQDGWTFLISQNSGADMGWVRSFSWTAKTCDEVAG